MRLTWLTRGLRTGIVTTRYPRARDDAALAGVRGVPHLNVDRPGDAEAARICAASCLPRALRYVEENGASRLDLDERACIMCDLCVRASADGMLTSSSDVELASASEALRSRIQRLFGRSFFLRHVDAGSCNGCESELKMLTAPHYDLHRLNVFFSTSPRAADALLVTGPVTSAMEAPLRRTYEAMPEPKLVLAIGACACTGGVFVGSPSVRNGLADVLPVDVWIPGCPPTPIALIQGLMVALDRAERR